MVRRPALSAAVLLVVTGTGAIAPPQSLRAETVIQTSDRSLPIVVLTHEVISDPAVSSLLARPIDVTVGEDGREYHLDGKDKLVRVLDRSGHQLFDMEGTPAGPFHSPWKLAVAPDGRVAVFERAYTKVEIFTPEGRHLSSVEVPIANGAFVVHDMLFLDDTTIAFGASSLHPDYFGFAIHVFRVESFGFGQGLVRVRSFGETPYVDPVIYTRVTGGRIARDLDGAILYAQMTPYSLRKYSIEGEEIWRIDDPELVPVGSTFFGVSEHGRLESGHFPFSYGLFPLAQDLYLHMLFFPPEGLEGTFGRFPEGVTRQRRAELVRIAGDSVTRAAVDMATPLTYIHRDEEGRLYGEWNEWEKVLIRSSVTIRDISSAQADPR